MVRIHNDLPFVILITLHVEQIISYKLLGYKLRLNCFEPNGTLMIPPLEFHV